MIILLSVSVKAETIQKDKFNLYSGLHNYILYSVIETDNGYIAVGESDVKYSGVSDGIMINYDSKGNQISIKTLEGELSDEFNLIQKLPDGYIVFGKTLSNEL